MPRSAMPRVYCSTAISRTSSSSITLPSLSIVPPPMNGRPSEEATQVLDDDFELALEVVDGPGKLLGRAAVADDDTNLRLALTR